MYFVYCYTDPAWFSAYVDSDRCFYSFAFTDVMPKLNTNNEEVIEYFCKVCEDWIRKFDIDGIHDFFLDKTMKKEEFEYMVNRCYTMYMQQNNDVLFNLLDSHDTERLMNRFHDLDKFYQQLAILFTLPGSPCIYYGTEIAMEVLLNASNEKVKGSGEVLFAREFDGDILGANGTLIRRI